MEFSATELLTQFLFLCILAIPIACVSWTVTHEDIFKEPHEWLVARSKQSKTLLGRKFFHLFTCEYCFSHWVTLGVLVFTNFRILFSDWRGLVAAGFATVWVANVYMSLYGRIRLEIKEERVEIESLEQEIEARAATAASPPATTRHRPTESRTARRQFRS
jgi:hypothetical protein